MEYKRWKVRVKEVGNDNILTPEVWGYYTKEQVIEFLGLNKPDVEWYEMEEISGVKSNLID
jgi:hypothetical protein